MIRHPLEYSQERYALRESIRSPITVSWGGASGMTSSGFTASRSLHKHKMSAGHAEIVADLSAGLQRPDRPITRMGGKSIKDNPICGTVAKTRLG